MIARFLGWLVRRLKVRRIEAEDGLLYLERARLRGWMPDDRRDVRWSLYLHRFHRPDLDRALHNHPWKWAVSLVLAGGYTEEYLDSKGAQRVRRLRPWRLNILTQNSFHRITELHGEVWTLFLTGPKVSSWGFLVEGGFVFWRERLRQRGIEPSY